MAKNRKSTRRQFLQGGAAAAELRDAAGGTGSSAALLPATLQCEATYLFHLSRAAMACDFEVFFNAGEYRNAGGTALEVFDLVEQLEDQLTVYREHSEVSRLNRRAADEAVVVEPRLFRLLKLAVEIHDATEGAFDITAGPLTKVWGFYRRAGRIPTDEELREARECVGSRWLELDSEAQTVRFLKPGVEINLGAIGKGYALDRCAEWFLAAGIENYVLHGGMSSVLARGNRAGAKQPGWTVGVVHPQRLEKRLAEIYVHDRALGTSGAGTQFFHHQGKRYGHILDPRTGWPAEGVLSATVLAPTAAEADALATAFYVLGAEKAVAFCETRPGVAALLVFPGVKSGGVEIRTAGLADSEWRSLL
jgi:thiamine biosynthesis lipoprotein